MEMIGSGGKEGRNERRGKGERGRIRDILTYSLA